MSKFYHKTQHLFYQCFYLSKLKWDEDFHLYKTLYNQLMKKSTYYH